MPKGRGMQHRLLILCLNCFTEIQLFHWNTAVSPEHPRDMDGQIQDFLPGNKGLRGLFHISADFHGGLQFIGVLAADLLIEEGIRLLQHTAF